jgi:hypothetical protein
MLVISCPVCGESVTSQELPSRLPLVVPEHGMATSHHCGGSGRDSSRAWMVSEAELRRAQAHRSPHHRTT